MPSHKCSYFKCKNISEKKSMFRFPSKDAKRLKVWLENCGTAKCLEETHDPSLARLSITGIVVTSVVDTEAEDGNFEGIFLNPSISERLQPGSDKTSLTESSSNKDQTKVKPTEVASTLEERIKSIVLNVYNFLEREYRYLVKKYADVDLSPLADVRQRTAEATGISQEIVADILGEEKNLVPAEKRRRLDSDESEGDRDQVATEELMIKSEERDSDDENDDETDQDATETVMIKLEERDSDDENDDDNDDQITDTRADAVTSNEHIKTERDDGVFHAPLTQGGMFTTKDSFKSKPEDGGSGQHSHREPTMRVKMEPVDDEFDESGMAEVDIVMAAEQMEFTEGFS